MTVGFCYLTFPCEEKKKKRKTALFRCMHQPGFEPKTTKKMAKPDINLGLYPRSLTF